MLKRLSLYGFKTFARKTEIDFGEGITCIVGPNGSGKSNISDALRWVLGEQGMKTLRSDKLTEVIFVGSEYAKPLNMAEVVLLMENKREIFPLKYSEIEITRRVYRDNKSEFSINRSLCRLKDIQEIFLDTGLGKGGISMIGQGQIEKIISADPVARRALFEETAGINKYQYRKQDALKKIETTQSNLLRLSDIIFEVEGRIGPLKKEVNRLKRYKRYKERMVELEKELLLQEYFLLVKKEEEAAGYVAIALEDVESIKLNLKEQEHKQKEFAKKLKDFYKNYESHEENHSALRNEVEEIRTRYRSYSVREKELKDRLVSACHMNGSLKEQMEELKKTLATDRERFDELNNHLLVLAESIRAKETLYSKESAHLEVLRKACSSCKEKILHSTQKILFLSREMKDLSSVYEGLGEEGSHIREEMEKIKNSLSELASSREIILKNIEEINLGGKRISGEIDRLNYEKSSMKKSLEDYRRALAELYRKFSDTEVKFNFLKSLEKDFEGYFPGVKAVMKAKGHKKEFKGLTGVVGSLIKVPLKYEKAIEVALGGHIQDIVTETDEDARLAVEYLRETGKGRATFLPLNLIKGNSFNGFVGEGWTGLPCVLGSAGQLIEYDRRYKNIIDYLLGHFYIVTDLKKGLEILKSYNISATLVTLEGDILRASGAITGGSLNNKKGSLLSRSRETEELKKKLAGINREKADLEAKERETSDKIKHTDITLREKTEEMAGLQRRSMELLRSKDRVILEEKQADQRLAQLKSSLESSGKKREEAGFRMGELQGELEVLREEEKKLEKEKNQLDEKLSLKEKEEGFLSGEVSALRLEEARTGETVSNLNDFISSREIQFEQVKENFRSSSREIREMEETLEDMKKKEGQDEQKLSRLEEIYKKSSENFNILKEKKKNQEEANEKLACEISLIREDLMSKEKVMNDYQVNQIKITTEKDMLKTRIPEISEPEFIDPARISEELETLTIRVREMGFVNYNAEEEYEEVSSRYSFLISQKADMEEAIFSLHKVIEEADRKSRAKFKDTFEQVSEEFSLLYKRLFPGGRGYLKLTDEEDYLKSGIDIFINPPGKKSQSISLLSGGEKSMAALILLFSIFTVKPTPFCVFDEVDASLDDANTHIFAECLEEFSTNSQFIVISHNKITMEKADVLYGISMEEPGVSDIISLKLGDPVLEELIAREAVV